MKRRRFQWVATCDVWYLDIRKGDRITFDGEIAMSTRPVTFPNAIAALLSQDPVYVATFGLEQTELMDRVHEPVSAPIRARSDEGAIFELLASVGCRMPR